MSTMSEPLPLATTPDLNATSDIFSAYITFPGSPSPFDNEISSPKTSRSSHDPPTTASTISQRPSDAHQNDPADQSSSPPRKRRKGGKIFSGCSTCRQRKMKCDQKRPVCSNCARSRLYVCRGFEDDSISQGSSAPSRPYPPSRPRPRPSSPHETKSSVELPLQDATSTLGAEMNNLTSFFFQDDVSLGFNSSFLSPIPQQLQPSRALYSTQIDTALTPSDIPSFIDDVSFWNQLLDSNNTTEQDSQETRDLIQLPPLSRVASPFSSLRSSHSLSIPSSLSDPTNLPGPFSELFHHYRTLVAQQMMPTCSPSQNPWLQLYVPLALQEPRTEPKQTLLHAMLAVSAFSRALLAGAEGEKYRLQGVQHGEEAVKRIGLAIHGKIGESRGDSGKETSRQKQRQKRADMDPADKQALLAAALMISTIDVFSGAKQGTGYTYLRLAKEVIQLTGGISWWLSAAPPTMTIFQMFRCYNIIASTTTWPCQQIPGRGRDRFLLEEDDNENTTDDSPSATESGMQSTSSSYTYSHSLGSNLDSGSPISLEYHQNHIISNYIHEQAISTNSYPSTLDIHHATSTTPYTLDISFGIAMKTLWCLNKTVSLSTIHSTFPPGKTWSASQLLEIQELQNELDFPLRNPEAFRASISNSSSGGGGGNGSGISQMVMDEIKENHVWAFHYSVILFFRRALAHTLPSPSSSSTPSSSPPSPIPAHQNQNQNQNQHHTVPSQTLISLTLTHLENIDTLAPSLPISNKLWPGFIASAESVCTSLRHRSLAWFVRARRHGIGNIEEAKKLVMEVWRREDRERYVVEEREGERGLAGGLGSVDWRAVMREMGVWVMLT